MRWQELFADLEAEAEGWAVAERHAEVADRTRAELSHVTLTARMHHCLGREVRLSVAGAGDVAGRLTRLGAGWLLVDAADETVVLADAIAAFWNLPAAATARSGIGAMTSRYPMTAVLRAIARDRSQVAITSRDGRTTTGTPDRVGADWVEMAVHEWGESERQRRVQARVTVALGQVATVRRGRSGWD